MIIYSLDVLLSLLEPVCRSMSSSNYCFLTCIQVSQEADQMVWYSHILWNFPQFIVIHTIKGFDIFSKAEIYVFLQLSCFFDDPADIGSLMCYLYLELYVLNLGCLTQILELFYTYSFALSFHHLFFFPVYNNISYCSFLKRQKINHMIKPSTWGCCDPSFSLVKETVNESHLWQVCRWFYLHSHGPHSHQFIY